METPASFFYQMLWRGSSADSNAFGPARPSRCKFATLNEHNRAPSVYTMTPRGFTDYFDAQSSCLGKSAKDPVTFKTLEPQGCDSLWQKDIKKTVLDYTTGLGACKMSHFAGSKARD